MQRGDLGLSLVDITDAQHPRMAMLDGDEMLYAASLPKIAILLGAFVEAEQGRLTLDGERLIDILQSPKFGFYAL